MLEKGSKGFAELAETTTPLISTSFWNLKQCPLIVSRRWIDQIGQLQWQIPDNWVMEVRHWQVVRADLTCLFFFINLTVTHRAFQSLTSGFLGYIISNLWGRQQWSNLWSTQHWCTHLLSCSQSPQWKNTPLNTLYLDPYLHWTLNLKPK